MVPNILKIWALPKGRAFGSRSFQGAPTMPQSLTQRPILTSNIPFDMEIHQSAQFMLNRSCLKSDLSCHSEPFDCRSRQAKAKNLIVLKIKVLFF